MVFMSIPSPNRIGSNQMMGVGTVIGMVCGGIMDRGSGSGTLGIQF